MAFQSIVPAKLGSGAIGVAKSTLYTVPASTRTFVKDIDIANNGPSAVVVYVWLVSSGGTVGDGSNTLLPGITVQPNSVLQWTGSQILAVGDTIQIQASLTGCSILASGGEAT